jgi:hypothetical protein
MGHSKGSPKRREIITRAEINEIETTTGKYKE